MTWFLIFLSAVFFGVLAFVPWVEVRRLVLAGLSGIFIADFLGTMRSMITGGAITPTSDIGAMAETLGLPPLIPALGVTLMGLAIVGLGLWGFLRVGRKSTPE